MKEECVCDKDWLNGDYKGTVPVPVMYYSYCLPQKDQQGILKLAIGS